MKLLHEYLLEFY